MFNIILKLLILSVFLNIGLIITVLLLAITLAIVVHK